MSKPETQTFLFSDDGRIPNNPTLPLVVYKGVLPDGDDPAALCRDLFRENFWGRSWVNGIFPYHHYHSIAHEVLGIVGGSASVLMGGEHGQLLDIQKGDVLIIPAGVGHCRKRASTDFQVVGAYPLGQDWDLCTGEPDERPQVLSNIQQVPLPQTDPVFDKDGPLLRLWMAHDAE